MHFGVKLQHHMKVMSLEEEFLLRETSQNSIIGKLYSQVIFLIFSAFEKSAFINLSQMLGKLLQQQLKSIFKSELFL